MASAPAPFPSAPSAPGASRDRHVAVLFSNAGLVLAVLALLLAAWFGQVPIALLAGLTVSTIVIARLWSFVSLRGVTYERLLDQRRLFPGEHAELKVRITNHKPLPLLWLEAEDRLPTGLALESDAASTDAVNLKASLLWYQRLSWSCKLKAVKRGCYRLGPAELRSGDIFGFYPRCVNMPPGQEVLVYPRIYPLSDLGLPVAQLWGDIRTQSLVHDPTRYAGIREHRPNDPLKHIHWKASARKGELQVKTFESTGSLEALLLVDIDGFAGASEQEFEHGLSTAASLAYYLAQQGYPVGLVANTASADSGEPVVLLPGSSRDQLGRLLEALARTTATACGTLEALLAGCLSRKPAVNTVFVIVTCRYPAELVASLGRYGRSGCRRAVVNVGDTPCPVDPSVRAYHVAPPAESGQRPSTLRQAQDAAGSGHCFSPAAGAI